MFVVIESANGEILQAESMKDETKAQEMFDGLLEEYCSQGEAEELTLVVQIEAKKERKFEHSGYKLEIVETKKGA